MSEYQYYEFRAIDDSLTRQEQSELRAYSTRARITATSFTNEYHWGSFKGDEEVWMERYFDAFLYVANWGTRQLMLRIPASLLPKDTVDPYCQGDTAKVRKAGMSTILTFLSEETYGEEWLEGDGLLSSVISIRSELSRGDLRSLYLGWLRSVQDGSLDEEELEPPIPDGLGDLTEAQREFVSLFAIDEDLLWAAAQKSPPQLKVRASHEQISEWMASLSGSDRDDLLSRLITGHEPNLANELYLRATRSEQNLGASTGRTVGDLLLISETRREIREQAEAEQRAREAAQRQHGAAVARAKYLNKLSGNEAACWEKIEMLAVSKVGARYDEAINLLIDLRELADRGGQAEFGARMEEFRIRHSKRLALIERLNQSKL